ncbi:glutathione peroxidase [Helcobacillus massiliensis]|uniref:glutathione peroxidase n=1 Tax=Helcobacillus massiliensis TaxID=521392 RepID=UPI0021A8753D|nr:glutathione peroxidase [Helcobacillus massiliensis]MCT1556740.1 glutathione peroxidase [Helcobacillus massiliensis]MCT2035564.1 glutathione peroxidase [Helcobacillus massiliensis]MCT2330984.1 glutathione peroxidase [Helcobacillus massiliensis]
MTETPRSIRDFSALSIDGQERSLADFAGQVLLIVNTASECGFTKQYAGLQQLQDEYSGRGFSVLGFPCDQFGHQEPGSDEEIAEFCSTNFSVDFPMFSKIEVNGPGAHPLYQWLKASKPGIAGGRIAWNFTKFLIDRDGHVVDRFGPPTAPARIARRIDTLITDQ